MTATSLEADVSQGSRVVVLTVEWVGLSAEGFSR